jgi:ABC-type Na+ efflux pump permease subunit
MVMASGDPELQELQRRLARLELLLASVEFDKSIWGKVLRLLSVAIISFIVVWFCGFLGIRP